MKKLDNIVLGERYKVRSSRDPVWKGVPYFTQDPTKTRDFDGGNFKPETALEVTAGPLFGRMDSVYYQLASKKDVGYVNSLHFKDLERA